MKAIPPLELRHRNSNSLGVSMADADVHALNTGFRSGFLGIGMELESLCQSGLLQRGRSEKMD